MTKFHTVKDKKAMKEAKDKLTMLDLAILTKCEISMNIVRVLKAGKPYINKYGRKEFATTDEILAAVKKLEKLGVLERR